MSIETLIAGLYCVHHPGAVSEFQNEDLRQLPLQLRSFARVMDIPESDIRAVVAGMNVGHAAPGPKVEQMATAIDKALKLTEPGAVALYDTYYRPLSAYSAHSGASALMRYVDDESGNLRHKPEPRMARRTPARIADACVGILAAAIARETGDRSTLAEDYATKHVDRALPPIIMTVRGGAGRLLAPSEILTTWRQLRDGYAVMRHEDPRVRTDGARRLLNELLSKAAPDLPQGALDPIIELLVNKLVEPDRS